MSPLSPRPANQAFLFLSCQMIKISPGRLFSILFFTFIALALFNSRLIEIAAFVLSFHSVLSRNRALRVLVEACCFIVSNFPWRYPVCTHHRMKITTTSLCLSAAFKEICPGGLGYHVTNPYVYKPKPPPPPPVRPEVYERGDGQRPVITHPKPTVAISPLPVPTVQQPVEAFGFTERHLPVRGEP